MEPTPPRYNMSAKTIKIEVGNVVLLLVTLLAFTGAYGWGKMEIEA